MKALQHLLEKFRTVAARIRPQRAASVPAYRDSRVESPRRRMPGRAFWLILAGVAVLFLAVEISGFILARRGGEEVRQAQRSPAELRSANDRLEKKIAGLRPKDAYLVVDTAANRVTMRQGDTVLRDMLASCGSGNVLEDPASGRRWVFDTPRGQHRIKTKVKNPLWIKPDWAFLEEGEPIPTNAALRAEPGVMGDYALGIGNGYFLHGTLYKRMLGRNVSHGCVRLGDEDLAFLYRSAPIGMRVFIF